LGIMPSRSEGFGIACLESMACGLPMVVSRCGGPEHFAVGEIIDTESAKQLADGALFIFSATHSYAATLIRFIAGLAGYGIRSSK
jgi:glycosyltransferase involved in cell wall biosynthesis